MDLLVKDCLRVREGVEGVLMREMRRERVEEEGVEVGVEGDCIAGGETVV